MDTENIWFLQNGAHTAKIAIDLIRSNFLGCLVPRYGADVPCSPSWFDLTLCNFFLWGYLKSQVYVNRPRTLHANIEDNDEKHRRATPRICFRARKPSFGHAYVIFFFIFNITSTRFATTCYVFHHPLLQKLKLWCPNAQYKCGLSISITLYN